MNEQAVPDLIVDSRGATKVLTLNRPKALNALTAAMRAGISGALWSAARDPLIYAVVIHSASDRAFSSGSDVREVIGLAHRDKALARKAFADEYALNWQCECFSKPTVPLIDGMVMGGGVGVSLYGTHRVAGERYRFGMPETMIGLFPDIGACHVFARMPGHIGQYLGLTGRSIGRGDAYALGLVTHCINAEHFVSIMAQLEEAWPVDTILDGLHQDPPPGELVPHVETIDRCFSAESVEDIVARLEGVTGAEQAWAHEVALELRARSPLSLKITHRHIRECIARDIRQTLMIDYRLACRMLDGHDFYEGVRAVLIDKDHAPRWQPMSLADVTVPMIDRYFSSLGGDDLGLATRGEMQELRS